MALKTTNKNRKVVTEALIDTVVDTHESALAAIEDLVNVNKDITWRNTIWTLVGVTVGIALLVLII